jgi:uncharacterized membrane protein required for colicin V production
LFSVLLATAQGFLHEVISLAGVVIGYLLAAREYWRLDSAAFLAIFFAVVAP